MDSTTTGSGEGRSAPSQADEPGAGNLGLLLEELPSFAPEVLAALAQVVETGWASGSRPRPAASRSIRPPPAAAYPVRPAHPAQKLLEEAIWASRVLVGLAVFGLKAEEPGAASK